MTRLPKTKKQFNCAGSRQTREFQRQNKMDSHLGPMVNATNAPVFAPKTGVFDVGTMVFDVEKMFLNFDRIFSETKSISFAAESGFTNT
jgi:hypothetical protein